MKLLFDENLPPVLPQAFTTLFPGSQHVHALGLGSTPDVELWNYARDHSFALVTKDSDFHERSLIFGSPPKIVWIRRGNCSTDDIADILRNHKEDIEELVTNSTLGILTLF